MTAHVAYARRVNQWLEWGGSRRLPLGWKINLLEHAWPIHLSARAFSIGDALNVLHAIRGATPTMKYQR
jgi:hypothetical protein